MPLLPLVRLHPRPRTLYLSQNFTVLATNDDGFFNANPERGLFVHQTRLLSRYQLLIDGKPPHAVASSNIEQHSWLGYYISAPAPQTSATQKTIEIRLSRSVADGFHEDVDLTNFTQENVRFTLQIQVDGDFADMAETQSGERQQQGALQRSWRQASDSVSELFFDYHAEHAYDHQSETGTASIHRALRLRVEKADSPVSYEGGTLSFRVELAPQQTWHACLIMTPFIDGNWLGTVYPCYAFTGTSLGYDRKRRMFLDEAARFSSPRSQSMVPVVVGALEQARRDLAALRLYDLDHGLHAWLPAAGLPVYVALFGRDTLLSAWQSGLISQDLLRGTLAELARWQGDEVNDWRDEQPGRIIHQVQDAPLSTLNFNPLARYYGTMASPVFYSMALSSLWLWTGANDQVRPWLDTALRGIRWLDTYADEDRDGFYEYRTRSTMGLKNQLWKDSGDSMVYPDGSQVPDPIASCEIQGMAYIAKAHLAVLLEWLGDRQQARQLYREAEELKKRFNDRFWMEEEGTFGLGLDRHKRLIRTISSDPGACLAAGIVDQSRARRTADRLMADDMFSGWGVRTLSAKHPAYNPFSYQRGSVWPVENGILALALLRYGLHDHVERLCRAQFEAAALFDFQRLPEVFCGQPRDDRHPFPALYPAANWPQAWSSSAVFCFLQALLGLFPFAPLHVLAVDPHLPEWLPEITLWNLHLGEATVDLRFYRKRDGRSDYEVLDARGPFHVVRQPSPWSITAGWGERLRDLFTSVVHR